MKTEPKISKSGAEKAVKDIRRAPVVSVHHTLQVIHAELDLDAVAPVVALCRFFTLLSSRDEIAFPLAMDNDYAAQHTQVTFAGLIAGNVETGRNTPHLRRRLPTQVRQRKRSI